MEALCHCNDACGVAPQGLAKATTILEWNRRTRTPMNKCVAWRSLDPALQCTSTSPSGASQGRRLVKSRPIINVENLRGHEQKFRCPLHRDPIRVRDQEHGVGNREGPQWKMTGPRGKEKGTSRPQRVPHVEGQEKMPPLQSP